MREIGNSVSGGGAVEGEGLRSVSKQMSLKSRLLAKKSREEQSRGRLQIREISESGELEQAETVAAHYDAHGFNLTARADIVDWSTLTLTRNDLNF